MKNKISLFFVILIIIINEFNVISTANSSNSVCNSTVCENAACDIKVILNCENVRVNVILHANLIRNARNEAVKPCDDFYSYVCGNWPNIYQIPEDYEFINLKVMAEMKLKSLVQEILQKPVDSNDSEYLSFEKRWFNACVDTDTVLSSRQSLLMEIIEGIGGLPLAMNPLEWEMKNISWQEIDAYYINLIGKSVFFNLEVVHYNNTPKLFLAKLKTMQMKQMTDNILSIFAEGKNWTISEADVRDVRMFQYNFNEIIELPSSRSQNSMTLAEFQGKYNIRCPELTNGYMNFSKIISTFLNGTGMTVNGTQSMHLNFVYLIELCNLLNQTSSKTIANYIHWSFLIDSFDYWYVSDEMLIKENRVKQCAESMPFFKGSSLEIIYNYTVHTTWDLVQDILITTGLQIQTKINSSWMRDSTFLQNKLDRMQFQFGFFYGLSEGSDFSDYTIQVTPYFLQNWINFKKVQPLKIKKSLESTTEHRRKRNVYHDSRNMLEITLNLLTAALFSVELPTAINCGNFGLTMARLMISTLSKQAREYDEMKNPGTWSKNLIETQEKKVECFEKQFKNYTAAGIRLLDFNVVETAALNLAFESYQIIRNKTINDLKLPGFEDVDMDKLFFITFAMNACEKMKPEFANRYYSYGLLPKSVKINLAVSNSEAFASTFQCKEGDILWKKDKCNYF